VPVVWPRPVPAATLQVSWLDCRASTRLRLLCEWMQAIPLLPICRTELASAFCAEQLHTHHSCRQLSLLGPPGIADRCLLQSRNIQACRWHMHVSCCCVVQRCEACFAVGRGPYKLHASAAAAVWRGRPAQLTATLHPAPLCAVKRQEAPTPFGREVLCMCSVAQA
jgi:hypothetical protein